MSSWQFGLHSVLPYPHARLRTRPDALAVVRRKYSFAKLDLELAPLGNMHV
jgi:hypothetical protein